jgi:hypothetical protein
VLGMGIGGRQWQGSEWKREIEILPRLSVRLASEKELRASAYMRLGKLLGLGFGEEGIDKQGVVLAIMINSVSEGLGIEGLFLSARMRLR